jgi:adenosylcobyric acid synthase
MNPILLKPSGEMSAQVVVHGKPLRDYDALEYREHYLPTAGAIVRESLNRLRQRFDVVVLEGAGSPAEINLKDRDIVNMRMAAWAEAPVILVADIDRGGVFASIIGTLELLEPEERARICGFVINKFRGDLSLLKSGLDWLEARTGKPVLGVMPYLPDLELEDEDSLSLTTAMTRAAEAQHLNNGKPLDIAVIRLPRMSNITDVDPLRFEPDVQLRFIEKAGQWGSPDVVIVPGSKNTIGDLLWLRESGLAALLYTHIESGGFTVGLCGGYEMFGRKLSDPEQVESPVKEADGLSLFDFEIVFTPEKRTERVEGYARLNADMPALPITGYEIHMGEVCFPDLEQRPAQPFRIRHVEAVIAQVSAGHAAAELQLEAQQANCADTRFHKIGQQAKNECGEKAERSYEPEGAASANGRLWGTFVHGILHNDEFRLSWLNDIRAAKGLDRHTAGLRFQERREQAFARLAEQARQHLDIAAIYKLLGNKEGENR